MNAALRHDARASPHVHRARSRRQTLPGEAGLHRTHERKFRTHRRAVRESLFTDSLDFDRFRSAEGAARDVFCNFFLRSERSKSAQKKIALKMRFRFQIRGAKRGLAKFRRA
jgi:hypothetical protein